MVSGDERETGRRAILNAGHTVAHAIERATGYGIPHGEAVALGLVAECELAERLGRAAPAVGERVARAARPARASDSSRRALEPAGVLDAMASDKKNRAGADPVRPPERAGRDGAAEGWTVAAAEEEIRAALGVVGLRRCKILHPR